MEQAPVDANQTDVALALEPKRHAFDQAVRVDGKQNDQGDWRKRLSRHRLC